MTSGRGDVKAPTRSSGDSACSDAHFLPANTMRRTFIFQPGFQIMMRVAGARSITFPALRWKIQIWMVAFRAAKGFADGLRPCRRPGISS